MGWVPQESARFDATAPAKNTLHSVGVPETKHFGAILIEFGDTKKYYTFSGLGLVPKSSKKIIGGLSCINKGQKCIQILWDH